VAKSSSGNFNINIFVMGLLLAVVLCATGFSSADALLQWVVPGIVLAVSVVAARFVPAKRARRSPQA
jgi:hypothetical protein